jgi:hypothetical protein
LSPSASRKAGRSATALGNCSLKILPQSPSETYPFCTRAARRGLNSPAIEPGVDVIPTAVPVIEIIGVVPRPRGVVRSSHPSRRALRARSAGSGSLSRTRNSACRSGSVWSRLCSRSRKVTTATSSFLASCTWGKPELPAHHPHIQQRGAGDWVGGASSGSSAIMRSMSASVPIPRFRSPPKTGQIVCYQPGHIICLGLELSTRD